MRIENRHALSGLNQLLGDIKQQSRFPLPLHPSHKSMEVEITPLDADGMTIGRPDYDRLLGIRIDQFRRNDRGLFNPVAQLSKQLRRGMP